MEKNNRIVILGGSFETGKTTMYEALQDAQDERYRFIPDSTAKLLEAHPEAMADVYVLQEVFKQAIAEHVSAVKSYDGRVTICDTGLVDIAARAQFVLETRDFVWLNRHMKEQDARKDIVYIKLPVCVVPTDIPEGVQYNQHHKIDRILRKNQGIHVEKVSKTIQAFKARLRKVMQIIQQCT